MMPRGFAQIQIILVILGVAVVIGAIFASTYRNDQNAEQELEPQNEMVTEQEPIEESMDGDIVQDSHTPPAVSVEPNPVDATPAMPEQEIPELPPQEEVTEPEIQQPQEEPAPVPYNPGFQTTVRITPEIPSENERAALSLCDGKLFTFDPVNFGAVTLISADGTFAANDPATFVWLSLPTESDIQEYDAIAPQDVYITHLAQEHGISEDPEDNTIYFALCKDVFGYVTHVKELSENIQKVLTDSTCFGKPHTGENACYVEVLDLIGRGSLLGKAGRIEGRVGFGVIDLRKERGLQNADQYSVKTNFAVCPFDYFSNPSGYYEKLTASTSLCQK